MNIINTMDLSASGLTAQRQRLNVIAENLANTHVTRTPQGGPYLRKNVILETRPLEDFGSLMETPSKVAVSDIVETKEGLTQEYGPLTPMPTRRGWSPGLM